MQEHDVRGLRLRLRVNRESDGHGERMAPQGPSGTREPVSRAVAAPACACGFRGRRMCCLFAGQLDRGAFELLRGWLRIFGDGNVAARFVRFLLHHMSVYVAQRLQR